ncbi:MAG: radical SAM protein, partial [Chloroflexota bacterium]|nr:radical SAM protein [Chloroflexota bacterium]
MSTQFEPAYVALLESGELKRRVEAAYQRLEACDICPRECGVNRLQDEAGTCSTGKRAVVSSVNSHFGE